MLTPATFELSLQSLEEHPDPKKLEWLKQQSREIAAEITAHARSDILMRLARVKDELAR